MEYTDRELKRYFKNIFGIRIHNIEPYRIALTHRSLPDSKKAIGKFNNERLEYLGDAVLDTIIADYLFHKYPIETEGALTQLRSKLVNRQRLNKLASKLGLHEMIRTQGNIQGGSIDGNAFEAVIGAIYIDQGFNKTYKKIIHHVILTHLDIEAIKNEVQDFKSKIYIWAQQHKKKISFHNELAENGHLFHCQLFIDNMLTAESDGSSIKQAEQLASEKAWGNLHNFF